jgi:outer membrane protein TolC
MESMNNEILWTMRYFVIMLVFSSGICLGQPADTLDLFECQRYAIENHPTYKQKELYAKSNELRIRNHSTNWYPKLDLNGKYTWQNEVVELPLPIEIPGFETPLMPHYNYKLSLDIQQTIFDGGITRSSKKMEASELLVRQQQVEVGLNQLKEQVNHLYFYILALQQQGKSIRLKLDELEKRYATLESGLKNQVFTEADLDIMKAEILNVKQKLSEIAITKSSVFQMLGDVMSMDITEEAVLVMPASDAAVTAEAARPEQVLYDLQILNLGTSMDLASKQRLPKAYVFGTLAYGNPGLNFFRDEFRGFYVVGAGLTWNIWDWNKTSRRKQEITIQQDIIRSQKEAFDQKLNIQLAESLAEITKYEEAVRRDKEIVDLRVKISMRAASRLENGVITATDYLVELDAETEARIRLETHRIQLVQARIDYLTAKGTI